MFFTNLQSQSQQQQYQSVPYKGMNRMVNFPVLNSAPIGQLMQSSPPPQHSYIQQPSQTRILWGEPTWFLFHTMAHKIKDDIFLKKRLEILNVIYTICCNLPCPDCATHAKEYLDKIQYLSIYSKQQLKDVLFYFHNEVNQRKGVELFLYTNLDEKYKDAIMRNMVINFMAHFDRKGKLLPDTMQRNTHIVYLKKWFNANIQFFDT